jgi:hypothetical protein
LKEKFKRLLEQVVDDKIEPLRSVLLKEIELEGPAVGQLVNALAIAELMGFDLSSEEQKKTAQQKVYYLARTKAIPSVRISQRRVRFDLHKVKQTIAAGGSVNSLPETLHR